MGLHAFVKTPSQAARLQRDHPEMVNQAVVGIRRNWDMPVTLWRAFRGFDIHYPGNEHNTLSFIIGGARVERRDGKFAGCSGHADADSFMLYSDGGSRRYSSPGDVRLCHIYFHASLVKDIASKEFDRAGDDVELRDDRTFARDLEMRRLIDQYVSRALNADCPPSRLEMDTRGILLGVHLVRNHSNRAVRVRRAPGSLGPRRLAAALDFIEANLAEKVTLADLANAVGLTERHFCEAFRRSTGMPPYKYLTARRIERAKRLLAGDSPLAEVALDCGFGSQQHFTTAFRQAVGTTPGALRAVTRW